MTDPGSTKLVVWGTALALAVLSGSACRRRRDPAELEVPAASAPPASSLPVDRALPGELAEGTERAFGLPLPRALVVRGRFPDMVFGVTDAAPDRVANFIRERVSADKVETGPTKTLFPRAIVRGQPGVELAIEVLSRAGATEVQVRNLSAVKMTPGLTEEERWKKAGLKPDGTPLDHADLE